MTKTADWKGSIGFQLGNKLYVNMTGNVNDPVYLEGKVNHIFLSSISLAILSTDFSPVSVFRLSSNVR